MNLAKVAGEKRKRAREEEEAQMDIDEGGSGSEGGDDQWMDVDGDETSPNKRVKSNSGGAVMAKGVRGPKSNRQLAGMRDDAVSSEYPLTGIGQGLLIKYHSCVCSKRPKLSSCGISGRENGICTQRLEKAIVRSKSKWWVLSAAASLSGSLHFSVAYKPHVL